MRRRPRKLTPRDKRALSLLAANGETKTAVEMTGTISLEIEDQDSLITVGRALIKIGFKSIQKGEKTKTFEGQ